MDSLPQGIWFKVAGVGLALFSCALFSFMETAITGLRLFNLKELATKSGPRYTTLFSVLEKEPQRVLIAILIASCLSNVVAADLITDSIEALFIYLGVPSGWNFFAGVFSATAAILVFGDIIPKNAAQSRGESILPSILWLTNITFHSMAPLVSLLSRISQFFLSFVRTEQTNSEGMVSEKEIQFLIEYVNSKGLIDREKSKMLHSIFDLADTTVKEIMVPITDVVMINIETSLEEIQKVFSESHYSRLPVYEGTIDNIVGMVHQKDLFLLLTKNERRTLKELCRPILFIPESMRANQLLGQFKMQRQHIAMVLNEYGGIVGLVTLEDTIEEIVGDINDEHESIADRIIPLEQGGWLVYAGIELEALGEMLSLSFDAEDAISLGGFLTEKLQHLPRKGEQFLYSGYVFQVQKATPKRVIQVLVFKEDANIEEIQ